LLGLFLVPSLGAVNCNYFLALLAYVRTPLFQITALNDDTIQVSVNSVFSIVNFDSAVYTQIEPHVYHIYNGKDAPILLQHFPVLRFRVEDGIPVQIHIGNGGDYTALPPGRTMPFLITSLITTVLSVVFFLIIPIILAILFLIRRKRKKEFNRIDGFQTVFLLTGTMLVFNNLALILRIVIQNFRSATELAPHIWVNYLLTFLAIGLFTIILWKWKKVETLSKWQKLFLATTTVFIVLLIVSLYYWRFFTLL